MSIASIPHHIVLGMAGHIDHGKTALVKALTGIDTDRLKEEKERGMTTDLGFAFLGDDIAIIDVPGHEKFVKTMVAGVNGVDMALLVVAADDGVMPQTREHFEILRLLQVQHGLIALNKTDLVEPDWLEMVCADIRSLVAGSFLEGSPIVKVSAVRGTGVEELKKAIRTMASAVQTRRDKGVFRMPIDRVFTIKGFGTVVAGTILSGSIHVDDVVELLPHGKQIRVRGLQVHDQPVTESRLGLRTAMNLPGIEHEAIERGDVVCAPGFFRTTSMADARFTYLAGTGSRLENRTRVRVHSGTTEVVARLILLDTEALEPGAEGFVQIHFERPVVLDAEDRFVVRSYSPVQTIGGGSVLDAQPPKHKRFQPEVLDQLRRLEKGDPVQLVLEQIARKGLSAVSTAELARSVSVPADVCARFLSELESRNAVVRLDSDSWCGTGNLRQLHTAITEALTRFHRDQPLRAGISSAELHSRLKPSPERKLFDHVLARLIKEGGVVLCGERIGLAGHQVNLSAEQQKVKEQIEHAFLAGQLAPPDGHEIAARLGKDAERILTLLIETGTVIRLDEQILMHKEAVQAARERIKTFLLRQKQATLSEIRQHLGTTRKFALPLLVYLDNTGFTERDGDVRRLKNSSEKGEA